MSRNIVSHPPLSVMEAEARQRTTAEWRKALRHQARSSSGYEVLIPSVILSLASILVLIIGGALMRDIAQAVLTGAVVTGGFGWTAALAEARTAERDRQINLGAAEALRYADLAGLDLEGIYLRHAELAGARLSGARAAGADLHGAMLADARLTKADLAEADLSGADMTGAGCFEADFGAARLDGASLRGARLGRANLRGASLLGTDLRGADLRGANLREVLIDDETSFDGAWVSPSTLSSSQRFFVNHKIELFGEEAGAAQSCPTCEIDLTEGATSS